MLVFLVETDQDSYLFDENLQQLTSDSMDATVVCVFQQESLAPAEDWEEWFLNYDDEMLANKIRELIRSKVKKIASKL